MRRSPWWKTKAAKRAALVILGAALGASCALFPEAAQPVCVAVVQALHTLGVP